MTEMRKRLIREVVFASIMFAGAVMFVDMHLKGWRMVVAMIFYMLYLSYKCAQLYLDVTSSADAAQSPARR